MAEFFTGGIKLKQSKGKLLRQPAVSYDGGLMLSVAVPREAELLVSEGDTAAKGGMLARTGAAAWYCPTDGKIEKIYDGAHPYAGEVKYIEITNNGAAHPLLEGEKGPEPASDGSIELLNDTLSGRPLSELLADFRERKIKILAVDAIEDQPYASPSMALLLTRYEEILSGLKLIAAGLGVKRTEIVYYRARPADSAILSRRDGLVGVYGKYPYERRYCENRRRTTGFIGAQTCIDALNCSGSVQRQTKMIITVAGSRVSRPANVWVPLGTRLGDLLDFCGVTRRGVTVIGDGPMNGKYVSDLSIPVCLGMRCVLCIESPPVAEMANCWGCADCAKVCPQHLMPLYIARFARHGRYDDAAIFGADRCIGCGCCSFVCSGGIEPMTFILEAKNHIGADEELGGPALPTVGVHVLPVKSAEEKEK